MHRQVSPRRRRPAEIIGIIEFSVTRLIPQGKLLKDIRHAKRGLALEDIKAASFERWTGQGYPYWATTQEVGPTSRAKTRQMHSASL